MPGNAVCQIFVSQEERAQLPVNAVRRVHVAQRDVSNGGRRALLAHGQQHVLPEPHLAWGRLLAHQPGVLAHIARLQPDQPWLQPNIPRLQPYKPSLLAHISW